MHDEPEIFIGAHGELLVQLREPLRDYKGRKHISGSVLWNGKAYSFSFNPLISGVTAAWAGQKCILDRKDGYDEIVSLMDEAAKRLGIKINAL